MSWKQTAKEGRFTSWGDLYPEFNKEFYAKAANAYLLFHRFSLESRSWHKKAPYEIKEILQKMPTTIKEDMKLNDELRALYQKCL